MRWSASGVLLGMMVACGGTATGGADGALVPPPLDAEEGGEVSSGDIVDAPTIPSTLSGQFIDLTESVATWPPFPVSGGDVAEGREPDLTYGVFADLTGTSSQAVILSGSIEQAHHRQVYRYERDTDALVAWEPDPLPPGGVAMVEDLDGDGYVDALMSTGEGMRVIWGHPETVFGEHTQLVVESGAGHDERTTFHLADIDSDGWLDILMADECGLVTMLRVGPRDWRHRPTAMQGFVSTDPYAIATYPRVDRPSPLLSLGDPDCGFYSAFESLEVDAEGYPLYEPVQLYEGLSTEQSSDGSTGLASMAPMGSAVADLNRDGSLDLVVTLDPMHAIIDGTSDWPVASPQPESGLLLIPSDSEHPQLGWGVALLDLDRDGLEDVIVAHGDDTSRFFGTDPSPGPQWATVHLNLGGFRFLDATDHLGLGRRGLWRSVTVGDLDGDAAPDLILGGQGEAPRVYRNAINTPNQSIALRLVGHTSNRLGIGARVVITPTGTEDEQLHVVGAMGSPKAISSSTVFAGLGAAASAQVRVTWPSGAMQRVSGLAAGATHLITEPALLTLTPADRRVPAGGDASVVLTIRPPEPATSVSVLITHGDGVPGQAVETSPGLWSVEVSPPTSPGSARLEVRVDGEPLAIRPRLWWDGP